MSKVRQGVNEQESQAFKPLVSHERKVLERQIAATNREYTEEERQSIIEGAKALGISEEEAFNRLGETTFDVYLNDVAYWRNVPRGVWSYYIGGYQVIKKWLSYREKRMLGRGISIDEAVEVRDMARRLVAIILLEPQLDGNYQMVKKEVYKWVENEGRLSPPVTG